MPKKTDEKTCKNNFFFNFTKSKSTIFIVKSQRPEKECPALFRGISPAGSTKRHKPLKGNIPGKTENKNKFSGDKKFRTMENREYKRPETLV